MAVSFLFPDLTLLQASQVFEITLGVITRLDSLAKCFFAGVSSLANLDEVPHNVPLVLLLLSRVGLLLLNVLAL